MSGVSRPVLACVVVVAGVGVVHGLYTDRWGPSDRLTESVRALDRVPGGFGDWAGQDVPYEPADMARAGVRGCVYRAYRNPRLREGILVLLVCGRGGPVSVHTPDVCYPSSGYEQLGPAKTVDVDAGPDGKSTFRVARFGLPGAVSPRQLEVSWAWSADGRSWSAPDNPRLAFARLPAVYKLYVVREFIPSSREEAAPVSRAFLLRALPDLGHAIAGGQP